MDVCLYTKLFAIVLFHRRNDPDIGSVSESLHSFIDVYMYPLYPLLRLLSCILNHIYHFILTGTTMYT